MERLAKQEGRRGEQERVDVDKKDKIGYTGHEKDKKEVKRRRQGEGRERVAESRHQSAWGRRGAGKSKRRRDKEGRKEPDRRHSGMTSVGGKVRGGGGGGSRARRRRGANSPASPGTT